MHENLHEIQQISRLLALKNLQIKCIKRYNFSHLLNKCKDLKAAFMFPHNNRPEWKHASQHNDMHLHLKMSSENQSCSAFWCFMYTHLVNVDLWFHPSESKNKKNYFSEYIWSCVYHWYGLWGLWHITISLAANVKTIITTTIMMINSAMMKVMTVVGILSMH